MSGDYLDQIRADLLAAALTHVAFDGWSEQTLKAAAQDAKVDPGMADLAFPGGPIDLVSFFWADTDRRLEAAIADWSLGNAPLSQRISEALRIYISLLAQNREAVRRAMAMQALPLNAPSALRCMYRSVDTMWRAVGDQSTDFNFYTKRATLAAVVAATVSYWLADETGDMEAVNEFIDRRIGDILRFEKVKARVRSATAHLPSPARLLGRLRYPGP